MIHHVHHGDVFEQLRRLPDRSVHVVVTSPPYWSLRSYLRDDHPDKALELGHEATPEEWAERLVQVFREIRRVLRDDGTVWLNVGDVYISKPHGHSPSHDPKYKGGRNRKNSDATGNRSNKLPPGYKHKDLVGLPWLLAFALRKDGWYLRSENIWNKQTAMPEPVIDRPNRTHEQIFVLSKSRHYFYDRTAVLEKGSSNTHPRRGVGKNSRMAVSRDTKHRGEVKHRNWEGIGDSSVTEMRNLRSVWTFPSEPSKHSHFATFPRRIPRLAILAGTSEHGCCPACGEPYTRVLEAREKGTDLHTNQALKTAGVRRMAKHQSAGALHAMNGNPTHKGQAGPGAHPKQALPPPVTIGWKPGCDCGSTVQQTLFAPASYEPVPCVVLDPFSGAGTTSIEASRLGRSFHGIELSAQYCFLHYCRREEMHQRGILGTKEQHHANDRKTDRQPFHIPPADLGPNATVHGTEAQGQGAGSHDELAVSGVA